MSKKEKSAKKEKSPKKKSVLADINEGNDKKEKEKKKNKTIVPCE